MQCFMKRTFIAFLFLFFVAGITSVTCHDLEGTFARNSKVDVISLLLEHYYSNVMS